MINFLKYRFLYFFISAFFLAVGFYSIVRWGFNFSIEFTGGTVIEYQVNKKIDISQVEKVLEKNKFDVLEIKKSNNRLFVKTKALQRNEEKKLKEILEKNIQAKISVLKSETVGPTIGQETVRKTIIAVFFAISGILLYITFAFKRFSFAISAILAMIHDFFILLGSYSLLSHFFNAQFDTMFVTALLTTMSFSVHDTIVIFDKIREYFQEGEKGDLEFYANKSLTETLVRSFNNSMTIIFMLLALSLLGGSTIKFFALALLIGTITGTYSSPFVAVPILILLNKKRK